MNKKKKAKEIGRKEEKILTESPTLNHIPEIGEKVPIPAGSAKLVKVWVEENWKDEECVESMLPEEQKASRKLVLVENDYNLSGSIPDTYMKDYEEEDKN